jgi:hypothetical protein
MFDTNPSNTPSNNHPPAGQSLAGPHMIGSNQPVCMPSRNRVDPARLTISSLFGIGARRLTTTSHTPQFDELAGPGSIELLRPAP